MANEGTTAQHQQALDDIRQIDEILHDDSDADEYIGSDLEIDEERDSEGQPKYYATNSRPNVSNSLTFSNLGVGKVLGYLLLGLYHIHYVKPILTCCSHYKLRLGQLSYRILCKLQLENLSK